MTIPKVSVITAVTGADSRALEAAYSVLCEQEGVQWEWVLQIDGEGEQPLEFFEDARVRAQNNGVLLGAATTRNRALMRLRGEMVFNHEEGDFLRPGALATLAETLAGTGEAAFVVGRARRQSGAHPHLEGTVEPGALFDAWVADDLTVLPVYPNAILWRRNILLAAGGWPALTTLENVALLMTAAERWPGIGTPVDVLNYLPATEVLGREQRQRDREQRELIRSEILASRALAIRYGLRRLLNQS